jgi:hypothetical protein
MKQVLEPTTEYGPETVSVDLNKQPKTRDEQLSSFAIQLTACHLDIEKQNVLSMNHGKKALESAKHAGKILNEAHKHFKCAGDWARWVKANLPFSDTTAWRYMKLANFTCEITDAETIREAYIRLGVVKKKLNQYERPPELDDGSSRPEPPKKDPNPVDYDARRLGDKLRPMIREHLKEDWAFYMLEVFSEMYEESKKEREQATPLPFDKGDDESPLELTRTE